MRPAEYVEDAYERPKFCGRLWVCQSLESTVDETLTYFQGSLGVPSSAGWGVMRRWPR